MNQTSCARVQRDYEAMLVREWEAREDAADAWNEAVGKQLDAIHDDPADFAEVVSEALAVRLREYAGDELRHAIADAITGKPIHEQIGKVFVALVESALDREAERRVEMRS